MTIYSNQNLHQRIRIHLVPIGKLLIVKLQQKILVQAETTTHLPRIMAVLLLIAVVIGKENISTKTKKLHSYLLVHHQKHQLLMPVDLMMVMLKNVFLMLKEYQVISILIRILMYV